MPAPKVITRPFLPGEILVGTTKGLIRIDAIQGCDRSQRAVLRIDAQAGFSLRATPDSNFPTANRGLVSAGNLLPGDTLQLSTRAGQFGPHGTAALGRVWGWLIADGYILLTRRGFLPAMYTNAILSFANNKRIHTHDFLDDVTRIVTSHCATKTPTSRTRPPTSRTRPHSQQDQISNTHLFRTLCHYGLTPGNKHALPPFILQANKDFLTGFLQSIFTAKGTLSTSSRQHYIRLKSTHLPFLRHLQLLLLSFGILSHIRLNFRSAGLHALPDHASNQTRLFPTKAVHALIIDRSNSLHAFHVHISFLPLSEKHAPFKHILDTYTRRSSTDTFTTTVSSITSDGIADVYTPTKIRAQNFFANGITITNGTKKSLGPNGDTAHA